jgi:hypothetical protein
MIINCKWHFTRQALNKSGDVPASGNLLLQQVRHSLCCRQSLLAAKYLPWGNLLRTPMLNTTWPCYCSKRVILPAEDINSWPPSIGLEVTCYVHQCSIQRGPVAAVSVPFPLLKTLTRPPSIGLEVTCYVQQCSRQRGPVTAVSVSFPLLKTLILGRQVLALR